MEETKRSINQIKNRTIQGKSSHLRWLFPFFMIGVSFILASVLLLMRSTGIFQVQQSFLPLITLGGLLSCFSLATLLLIRSQRLMDLSQSQKYSLTLVLILPVLGGMFAALPDGQLTSVGGWGLITVYFLAFAGVHELIEREAAVLAASENFPTELQHEEGQQFSQHDQERHISSPKQTVVAEETSAEPPELIDESNEALLKVLPELSTDSTHEVIEFDEEQENRSQWMSRMTEPNGSEVIEGGTLVQFARNQKVSVVHIGLFPALSGDLSISCDSEVGAAIRTRILEIRGYGISIEVKRGDNLEEEFETYLYYRICNAKLDEEVA